MSRFGFSLMGAGGAGTQDFDPVETPNWVALYYVGGPRFQATYTDEDSIDPWPDEMEASQTPGDSDADLIAGTAPVYDSSLFSGAGAVQFGSGTLRGEDITGGGDPLVLPSSKVIVAKYNSVPGSTPRKQLTSGSNAARTIIGAASNKWSLSQDAGDWEEDGVADTSLHLFVGVFEGTGDTRLDVDGVTVIQANCGSNGVVAPSIGGSYDGDSANRPDADIAFLGVYEGDVTEADWWPDFVAWVNSVYGISVS